MALADTGVSFGTAPRINQHATEERFRELYFEHKERNPGDFILLEDRTIEDQPRYLIYTHRSRKAPIVVPKSQYEPFVDSLLEANCRVHLVSTEQARPYL